MPRFKVSYYENDLYDVFELIEVVNSFLQEEYSEWRSVFNGSLSDCDAYIRLRQNENVDFD